MNRTSSEMPTTLQGKIVCITGICQTVSRDDLKSALIQAGAVIAGSVNKHTALLVAGESGVGSKYEKAKEMGIPIIEASRVADLLQKNGLLTSEKRYPAFTPEQVNASEQAIANVLAMVMLELGVTEVVISNNTRAKVLAGDYTITSFNTLAGDGTRFKLSEGADHAGM